MSLDKRSHNLYAAKPECQTDAVWIISAYSAAEACAQLRQSLGTAVGGVALSKLDNETCGTDSYIIGMAPYDYLSEHFE